MTKRNAQTAWPYRRVVHLVHLLAIDKSEGLQLTDLQTVARAWKVNPYGDYHELLIRLAQHALKAWREEAE